MMKGMTPAQLVQVVEFVQKHHCFGYVPKENLVTKYSHGIKYIDPVYDTRDQTFWCIGFRGMSGNITFRTNHFVLQSTPKGWKYDNLFDLVMAWMKDEFVPKADFYDEHVDSRKTKDDFDRLRAIYNTPDYEITTSNEEEVWFEVKKKDTHYSIKYWFDDKGKLVKQDITELE